MPELREVYEMVTKQIPPRPGALQRQWERQRRAARNRKLGTIALVAAIIAGVVLVTTNREAPQEKSVAAATTTSPPRTALGPALVGLNGSVGQELPLPPDAWMPELSRDGTKIAVLTRSPRVGFCGRCRNNRLALIPVGQSSGSFVYFKGGPVEVEQPAWSPDGQRIAFVGVDEAGGNRDIYVAQIRDGTDQPLQIRARRLTTDAASDEFPAWSPDGHTIYYDNLGGVPGNVSGLSPTQEIWSVPADGGVPTRLTFNDVPDLQPDVALDGTVALWRDGEIWTMDERGGAQRRLRVVGGDLGFGPRWSPDGTKLALLRYDPRARASYDPSLGLPTSLPLLQVIVVDVATGGLTEVGPRVASFVNRVSWTPDGSALLINRYDDGT